MTPTRIVVHNTANDAPAVNEINYMKSNDKETSFHFAVDDKEIIQAIPLTRNSWNAGDGRTGIGNRQGISIEICYSKSGGSKFVASEKLAVKLIAYLLKKYGWKVSKVTKHQDYSGKYCPHRTLDLGWTRFIKMIELELNPPVVPPEPPEEPEEYPFQVGATVYPLEDTNLIKTAGYADATPLLIKKGATCIVGKYHKVNGLYMALMDKNGVYYSSAWTKEFGKFSLVSPYMEENTQLKKDIVTLNNNITKLGEEIEQLKKDVQGWIDKLTTANIEKNTAINQRIEAVEELNALKKSRFIWIVEFLEKLFPLK